jgi:phage tail-like protein
MAQSYPLSLFHFQVEWGGSRIGFTEVSGLTIELQPIEYREGSAQEYQVTKMPGIPQYSNITLKRGISTSDNEFFQWLATVRQNQITKGSDH